MLRNLKIKNFALIENTEIDFSSGFNVIIGETGAGKSLILKSLAFLLGEKSSKAQIRTGETKIFVQGIFDNISSQTTEILDEFGIENEEILILQRTYDTNGKSEIRINGNIATSSMLSKISETLVQVYGQHESLILLNTSKHIEILDSFKPTELENLKNELATEYTNFQDIKGKIDALGGDSSQRERTLDLLDYQIKEIEFINPEIDEDTEIENKLLLMKNAEKISTYLQGSIDNINNGIIEKLKTTSKNLENLENFDKDFENLENRLNSAYYEILDILETLETKNSSLSFNEYELDKLDKRLDEIKNLKKKYGPTLEDVLNFKQNAEKEKNRLENAEFELDKLAKLETESKTKLQNICEKLSQKRKTLAKEFEEKMHYEFGFLGMKNAKFEVDFQTAEISAKGTDKVEFLFSANPGQALKPISKIISGGEMSRFMLALKNITSEAKSTNTLVFDEVDSGISGEVGSAISERIGMLAKNYQILCITHLPQVSAMAKTYIYVSKESQNGKTISNAKILEGEEIFQSIAKLSGGDFASEISLKHAKELKMWADNFKKSN